MLKQGEHVQLADGRVGYFQGKNKKGEALILITEVVAVPAREVKVVKEWR